MAINPVSMTSQSIQENTDVVIEVRYVEPPAGVLLDPPEVPNKLIGYYDGNSDTVRLYIVDNSGLRLLAL
jgi:hypothetical protein